LIVFAAVRLDLFATATTATYDVDSPASAEKPSTTPIASSKTQLLILCAAGVAAVYATSGSSVALSLGLSYATLTGLALVLIERARVEAQHQGHQGGSVIYSANGLLSAPEKSGFGREGMMVVIRDVAAAAAIGTGIAALMLEGFSYGELSVWGVLGEKDELNFGRLLVKALLGAALVIAHIIMDGSLLVMVSHKVLNVDHECHRCDTADAPALRMFFPNQLFGLRRQGSDKLA
jgi:hypothetical protein